MSKPNVGTWADFLIKACALLWFCSVFFIRFGFKREVFLPISLQRCYKIKSEAYQNFLNDITKAECQKNWLQSHITGIGSYFWCRKMSFIITSRVSFTFRHRCQIKDIEGVDKCKNERRLTGEEIYLANIWRQRSWSEAISRKSANTFTKNFNKARCSTLMNHWIPRSD